MGSSPKEWGTIFECWAIKSGRPMPRREVSFRMNRGLQLEPYARKEYEDTTGILMPAVYIERAGHPFLRATLDGLNDEYQRALEIKCPGKKDHDIALAGKIPDKY